VWNNRPIGAEALILFAGYFGLTSFYPQFLLWSIPIFVLYSVLTGFGPSRFLLVTLLEAATVLVVNSRYVSGFQKAVLLIPTMNAGLSSFSVAAYELATLPLLPSLVRSLLAASLFLLICWILRDMIQASRLSQPAT